MRQGFIPGFEPLSQVSHYDHDPLGARLGLRGAGPLALLTRDQLHPPMVDDEEIWADGARWYEGAVRHTLEAAALCGVSPGERILDVGCGLGGPARTLVDNFHVSVHGVSASVEQLREAERRSRAKSSWRDGITFEQHDCQHEYATRGFDVAWCMNMIYHVESKEQMLDATRDALRVGGRLLVDDWMLTPRASDADRNRLADHFLSPYFAVRESFVALLPDHGFRLSRFAELGHVGRTHLRKWFSPIFESYFRPQLVAADPEWGGRIADDFARAIELTIQLYVEEKLTYFRLVAVKG